MERKAGLEPVCGVIGKLKGGSRVETWGYGGVRSWCGHCLT